MFAQSGSVDGVRRTIMVVRCSGERGNALSRATCRALVILRSLTLLYRKNSKMCMKTAIKARRTLASLSTS